MRQFIRHPVTIPILVSAESGHEHARNIGFNVSLGGLAFQAEAGLEPGTPVQIRIPFVEPEFEVHGRVVWCHNRGNHYELGVAFFRAEDSFRTRMVEQVCHIEEYRRRLREQEGRSLSAEEAAREWIAKFAADFCEEGTRH